MALPDFGFALQLRNFASFMTRMTRVESGAKRTSKALVDFQIDVHDATVRRLAVVKEETILARKGVPLTAKRIADLKKEKAELKLLNAHLAETRKRRAAEAAMIGKQAREYTMLAFAMGIAAVALAKFNSANLKAGLTAEKSGIAIEALTANLGISRDAVAAEIAELQELNLTNIEAEQLIAKLINVKFDYRKASDIALIGIRASVVANKKQADAIKIVTDSIITMFPRQLRSLGLGDRMTDMTEALTESLRDYGLELTKNERRLAIYNALLRHTSDLRGVENLLLETATGNLREYNTQVKNLQENFGEVLLPAYIEILKAGNNFLMWLNKLPTSIITAISGLAALAGAMTAVGTSIITLAAVSKIAGLTAFAAGLTAALPWVGLVILIGAVILEFSRLIKKIKEVRDLRAAPVEAIAESIQTEILRGIIEDTFDELESRIKQIDIDLNLLEKSFERQRLKAQLILIPLRQQEKSIQRQIVLWQRLMDIVVRFAEGPLKIAQAALDLLADTTKDLDKALRPYEFALRRVEASAGATLIPLRAQERSLQRQLDLLQRRIALERRSLELVLRAAELSLRDIEDQVYALDKALWPMQDAFAQISADATLVLIPLRRQRREIERQIERMERLSEIEQKRIERHLRALEKQRDTLQDIIDVDRKRLDIINHEIFMEQQRNRILQRVTSARFLTMESQAAVMQDQLAIRQEEMKALNKQTRDERERLRDMRDALDEQLEPIRERLQILIDAITLEEDRVTFARENLQLEEARQTAARITLEQQRRLAEEEVEQAQRRLEAFDELAESRIQALEDEITAVGDLIAKEEERIQQMRDTLELARLGQTEERIALEKAIALWEDKRDEAQAHLDKVKETYDLIFTALKGQLTKIGDIIFKEEERLGFMRDIKDMADATLKIEKLQWEMEKKRLSTLEEIQELGNGTTGGPTAIPTPTVTAPIPLPAPPPTTIIFPNTTSGPTVQLEAHYGTTQSPATIVDDVELMLSYAR